MSLWRERGVVESAGELVDLFRATEALGANSNDVFVWRLVGLLDDVLNSLPLRGGGERVPSRCKITVSQTKDGVLQSVTVVDGVVDGHSVRHAVARDHQSASRQGSLDRHVHGGHAERLNHDLRLALSFGLGVERRLFRRNPEMRTRTVVPDLFHVVRIRDDTVLDGIRNAQHLYPGLAATVAIVESAVDFGANR